MSCETVQADLVALLHRELPPEREEEVRRHVEGCSACRGELEQFGSTFRAVRRQLEPIEPSAAFRSGLARRIDDLIEQERAAEPIASGAVTPPALEAVSTEPDAPSMGPASRRLQALTERSRKARWRPLRPASLIISTAAAAAFLIGAKFWIFRSDGPPPVETVMAGSTGQRMVYRRKLLVERRKALTGQIKLEVKSGRMDLASVSKDPAVDRLILVGHHFRLTDERCIIAFLPSQWNSFRRRGPKLSGYEHARWLDAVQAGRMARVEDGQVTIPPEILADYLGGSATLGSPAVRVSVLQLAGRLEIWSTDRLDRYLRDPRIYYFDVPTRPDDAVLPADRHDPVRES